MRVMRYYIIKDTIAYYPVRGQGHHEIQWVRMIHFSMVASISKIGSILY